MRTYARQNSERKVVEFVKDCYMVINVMHNIYVWEFVFPHCSLALKSYDVKI